jgi:uncharacterized protein involved in exopolysaccharide biosynthesis
MSEEEEKEFTLVDFIKAARAFYEDLKKLKVQVFIIVLLGIMLGVLVAYLSKPKYIAFSTVMLESSKSGGGMSGAVALASQFGLLSGGGGSAMNEDKLLDIVKAETITKSALLQKATIKGKEDLLANHFIDALHYREEWKSDSALKEFAFKQKYEDGAVLTTQESRVLKMLNSQIQTNCLKAEKSKSGIIKITFTSPSEQLSEKLNEQIVKSLISFYTDRITAKGRKNVFIIEKRVDSIANALRDAEFALARWKDGSHQLVKVQGMVSEIKLRRNVEVCNSMYVEGIKQLEIAKFTLLDDTPFLQIIDQPDLPLKTSGRISLINGITGGFIISLLIAGLFVWLKKKFSELQFQLQNSNEVS